ncbi:Neuromodulin domain containing protein [Pyrenophora tritici-repentis]|uniref:FimV, Tfp pilus assembly protein FimV n=2 Tax=Pyrenophora tritici-repentis TaxID=45151 RepID=A0A2W1F4Y2_9PLEO|nr:uncharacterized protein PTRG_07042 [Pyrenophora tritici-repentis Pt-1C-BFP]KAA8614598.1 hypothetical protein PtrV1_11628 [Pyrenophora tritici-repentis]EDU49961.1 conserved hypothetical protein [Pyrenophora tritici-repentis Pt-1C-BFP]KAF7444431.1 hypothetical protein A1F99_109840 [Pyrenophora tritici-repentis]KAF7564918.1 FimV, Tfp pilus assembly protein FimV [Pyrenophora tritici-repentis]KAG9378674.1 hypothetical protein A1F94_010443 [Pyrenophora tritici-repentis]
MSNGVRNLRAMFENSNSASPEPRGRSPVDAAMLSDSSDRPRSRVRASFVPVEPPPTSAPRDSSTDLGQTKGTPSNSVAAHRRESFRVSQDKPDELAELKKAVSEEKEERRQSVAVPEAVPEQAVESRESSIPAPPIRDEDDAANMPNLGSIMKGSDFPESSTRVDVEVPAPVIDDVKPTEAPAVPEESAVEASEPTPKASPVLAAAQPAENPDKATTGAQEDVALRPAAPTEEAAIEDDKPAVDGAAAEHEAAISDESSAAAQPAENPDKPVTGAQEEATLKPAAPTDAAAVSGETATLAPPASSTETPKPTASKAKTNGTPATKKQEIKKPATISTTKAAKAPISAAKSPLPKAAPKTPPKPKAATPAAPAPKPSPSKVARPVSQAKSTASKEPVKAPVTKAPALKTPAAAAPAKKTSRTSLRPPVASSAPAPTSSAAAKPKAAAPAPENKKPAAPKPIATAPRKRHVCTSPTGFKKPAPKSPTRPVGLPSRLTAPTAASAAKHGEEQATKKPATTTRPATKIAAPKASRPSVAPTATTATKRPESRTSTASSAPKGGFLERMMRPTAASSSKTHEKPHEKPQDKPASPPRKAPAGSKPSTLQKGKKKVEEVAAKVKDAVTNGHDDEHKTEDEHKSEGEAVKESDTTEQAIEGATAEETPQEPAKAATPVQDVEPATEPTEPVTAEVQTSTAEAETVR